MKKHLPLLFAFYVLHTMQVYAFDLKHAVIPRNIKTHIDSTIIAKYLPSGKGSKDITLVYVDFNDCINCVLPVKTIAQDQKLAVGRTFLLVSHVPASRIKLIKAQFGLPDSITVLRDPVLSEYISTLTAADETRKSVIIRYNSSRIIEWMQLIKAGNINLYAAFMNSTAERGRSITLTNDTSFYTSIDKVIYMNGHFLVKTLPGNTLLRFRSNGQFTGQIRLDDRVVTRFALPHILALFPDSVKKRPNNHPDSVLKEYHLEIKPRGFEMTKFNNYSLVGDTLYVSATISLPIEQAFDVIRLSGRTFILTFNKNLEYTGMRYCNVDYKEYYKPLDFYGFRHNSNGTAQFAMIGDQQSLVPKNYFLATWKEQGNGTYAYKGIEPGCYLTDSLLSPYYAISKDLCYKFRFVTDSVLAFEYLPYVFNTSTGTPSKTIEESYTPGFYKLITLQPYVYQGTNHYLLLENIDGTFFLTLTTPDLKQRLFMKKVLIRDEHYFQYQGGLFGIDLSSEDGTVFGELNFSGLIR